MTTKKKGLGRGLDALLGSSRIETPVAEKLRVLQIDSLSPGSFQPRRTMDPVRLQELADSISAQGVVQPVVAREMTAERFELIAGERRWRAARMAGLSEIPVIVRRISDQAALAIALIENIQREDLNAMEEAEALRRLQDEYRMTHQQLADAVGKSRVTITNLLRLNDLHEDVKQLLSDGVLEMGHARCLLGLAAADQVAVAGRVAAAGMTVRATEALVQSLKEDAVRPARPVAPVRDPDIQRLEDDVSARLGASVRIRHGSKGAGQIIIKYNTLDELDGVLERFGKKPEH